MSYGYDCSDCAWLDFRDQNRWGEYYCPKKRQYFRADSRSCSNDFTKSNSVRAKEPCYLTTAMCEVLGLPDDTFCLETLRDFRDGYMKFTKEGPILLEDYDVVGPEIAENIRNDKYRVTIASTMYYNYIDPAVKNIINGNNENAVEIYKLMTLDLMDYYDIDYNKLKSNSYEDKGISRVRKPITELK